MFIFRSEEDLKIPTQEGRIIADLLIISVYDLS